MKHLKTIGFAAIAALALTAVLGVAGASASQINAESYSTTISSTNPYGNQIWNFHTTSTQCDAPQLSASLAGPSPNLTASAKEGKCYSAFTGNELKTNGCSFVYRPGAKTESGTFKGSVDIVCPGSQTISFTGGVNTCKVDVPAQNNLSATYENIGSGTSRAIKVSVSATGLKHSQVSGKECGGALGAFADGSWVGSWKIQGSKGASPVGIWLTGEGFELPPAGIAIAGSPLKLTAGTYPISISGSQGTQHVITLNGAAGGKTVKCSTANLSTSIASASAEFPVSGAYSGCTAFGFPGEIKMNGCTYTFSVINQAPYEASYAGHADISCPAGKSIEVISISAGLVKCTVTIGSQITNDTGYLVYTNQASTSTIGLELKITGIDYHQQEGGGLGRCTTGDFTDGTYTGTSTLVGSY